MTNAAPTGVSGRAVRVSVLVFGPLVSSSVTQKLIGIIFL